MNDSFPDHARKLLSLDGGAGFLVGVGMLLLRTWLEPFYALSSSVFGFVAAGNVTYGVYAGTLAIRAWRGAPPSRAAVKVLVAANAAWALVSVVLVISVARTASIFGIGHIVLEGAFCGFLAVMERARVLPYAQAR